MDSLERSGKRIEIQSCRYNIYNLLHKFTGNDQYEILKKGLTAKICKGLYIVLSYLKQEGRGVIIGIKPVFALK